MLIFGYLGPKLQGHPNYRVQLKPYLFIAIFPLINASGTLFVPLTRCGHQTPRLGFKQDGGRVGPHWKVGPWVEIPPTIRA